MVSKMNGDKFPDEKIFPLNSPTDFNKSNKKVFSESFVSENLNKIGWKTYIPLSDTGIDIIAIKERMIRFIQVKTREASEKQKYGFTPKQRDIKTDPRFFFFLYSDHTNDFIIISIYEFLKLIKEHSGNYFSSPTFKQGNGKINSFLYNNNKWYYNDFCIDEYVNYKGIQKMEDKKIDSDIGCLSDNIANLKYELLNKLASGNTFKNYKEAIDEIKSEKEINRDEWKTKVIESRKKEKDEIKKLDDDLKKSIAKYWYISPILLEWLNDRKY